MEKYLYVGTVFNSNGSLQGTGKGVYSFKINDDMSYQLINVVESKNSGIITISSDEKYLYAANELRDFTGLNGSGGGITAMKIKKDGSLEKINDSLSYGSRPSYLSLTKDNKYLLVSNHSSHSSVTSEYVLNSDGKYELIRHYDDSSIAVFKINEDGSIKEITDLKVFKNHGYWIYGLGQSTSHLHSVKIRDDNIVVACNRGADELEIMKLDKNGKLTLIQQYKTLKGYAPRHVDFHPTLNIVYIVFENYPHVGVYHLDNQGNIKELQILNTMPQDYYEKNPTPIFTKEHCDENEKDNCSFKRQDKVLPADIHLSNNHEFLFVSNRGRKCCPSSITSYRVKEDGTIEYLNNFNFDASDIRGFNFSKNDKYVYVGLLDKNKVDIYEIKDYGNKLCFVNTIEVFAAASMREI